MTIYKFTFTEDMRPKAIKIVKELLKSGTVTDALCDYAVITSKTDVAAIQKALIEHNIVFVQKEYYI